MYIVRMILGGQSAEVVAAEMKPSDQLSGMLVLTEVEGVSDETRDWLDIHTLMVREKDIQCVFVGEDLRAQEPEEEIAPEPQPTNHAPARKPRLRNG